MTPRTTRTTVPGIIDAATDAEGKVYAAPMSISVKSLVWYPKKAFEAAGYKVPKTQEELLALTDQIKADGTTPWCVGIEAEAATGWPATDWMEDYVLRFGGAESYDKWVKHEIPFNDPVVKQAADEIGKIWFTEGNVLGGRKAIASTNFATAGNPMFENPPGCFLHRQASFLAAAGQLPGRRVVTNLDNARGRLPAAADRGRRPGSRSWAAATWRGCSARTTRTPRRCWSTSSARSSRGAGRPRAASSPRTRTSTSVEVPQRDDEDHRQDRLRRRPTSGSTARTDAR